MRRPLEREAAKLETSLAALTVEKEQLQARLADPQLYEATADRQRLTRLLDEQTRLQREIEAAENRWLEVLAALEVFPGGV